MPGISCKNCGRTYPDEGVPYRCLVCGGVFDYDSTLIFDHSSIDGDQPGIWKYRHTFGDLENSRPVSLGEGNTPLVWKNIFGLKVGMKCEYENPTGSFKDRGSSLLTSFISSRNIKDCIEDSSGNAGASLAAYSASADVNLTVFVPESASEMKIRMIRRFGAEVVPITGSRSDVNDQTKKTADTGISYASHAYMPYNLPGYATASYEIFDQMDGNVPASIVIPVGQGGLLLGMARGFLALQRSGLINRIPKLIGVQARACAPLWSLFAGGIDGLRFATDTPTIAEGVRVWHPVRGDDVLTTVASSGGFFVAVDEEEIAKSVNELAQLGFVVEPTSALVWSALVQFKDSLQDPVILVLTGSGSKKYNPSN
jgi:threonine synthase